MKKIALVLVGTLSVYAGGGFSPIEPVEPAYTLPIKTIETQQDKMFHVYLMGGTAFHSIKSKNNISFTKGALDDKPVVFDVGAGHKVSENFFVQLAYQRRIFDQNDIDSVYASVNYILLNNEYRPYIGALVGYSSLTWNEDPTTVLRSFEKTSTSALLGVQAGVQVPVTDAVSIVAKYQFMTHTHDLDVRTTQPALENKDSHTVLGGIKYEF